MKTFLITLTTVFWAIGAAMASDADILSEYTSGSLRDQLYVVDSSELDPSESLNRVSGEIDLGFSAPGSTYKSSNQYLAGPFGMQGANDNRDGAE